MSLRNNTNASRHSLGAATLPPYTEYPADIDARDIELANLSRTNSVSSVGEAVESPSSTAAGPSTSTSTFTPTLQLQIQTEGKPWLSLPLAPKPVPIPVFTLTAAGALHRPLYLSIRPARGSGSCHLVHGDDETETPLSTTTYRFGPGKPPQVKLLHPADPERADEFTIEGAKLLSRTVELTTGLGAFRWRYAGSQERAAEAASSLLVFERVEGEGKARTATRVAQLVRNEQYRTAGSGASTAGNGGRLMLDLAGVGEKQREQLQLLVVTTALVMLKKEIDRRRMHQIAIMAGAGSGGG